MKVLVVDPVVERREELVDAICELPNVEVRGAAATTRDARAYLLTDTIDLVLAGELTLDETSRLAMFGLTYRCELVRAASREEAAAAVARAAAEHHAPAAAGHCVDSLSSRDDGTRTRTQTIDLREWLPRAVDMLRLEISPIVEVKALVADGTPPVRCVPAVLSRSVRQLVEQAVSVLPWGGTVWLVAEPTSNGLVRFTVVENGIGQLRDLTLSASRPAW